MEVAQNKGPAQFPWPPLVYAAVIAIGVILQVFVPLPWLPAPFSVIAGAIGWMALVASIALTAYAIRTLHKADTTLRVDRPAEHLVASGPFSLTRNPIYLSLTLFVMAIGIVTSNVWLLVMALVAAYVTQKLAIEPEERHLASRFGKRYRDYSRKVKRWL